MSVIVLAWKVFVAVFVCRFPSELHYRNAGAETVRLTPLRENEAGIAPVMRGVAPGPFVLEPGAFDTVEVIGEPTITLVEYPDGDIRHVRFEDQWKRGWLFQSPPIGARALYPHASDAERRALRLLDVTRAAIFALPIVPHPLNARAMSWLL
jgi:hypothetical protein